MGGVAFSSAFFIDVFDIVLLNFSAVTQHEGA